MAKKPITDPKAFQRRQMNPLAAALAAKGLVTADHAAAVAAEHGVLATPPPTDLDALVARGLATGAVVSDAAVDESMLAALEHTWGMPLPPDYRRFLSRHGVCRFRGDTQLTALDTIVARTRQWWDAHRSLRALGPLRTTLDTSLMISNLHDDEADCLLACTGPSRGAVFIIAHDTTDTPEPEPFVDWLADRIREALDA